MCYELPEYHDSRRVTKFGVKHGIHLHCQLFSMCLAPHTTIQIAESKKVHLAPRGFTEPSDTHPLNLAILVSKNNSCRMKWYTPFLALGKWKQAYLCASEATLVYLSSRIATTT